MTQPVCVIDEMRLKGKAMTQKVRHWLSLNGASMTQWQLWRGAVALMPRFRNSSRGVLLGDGAGISAAHRVAGVAIDRAKRHRDDFYATSPEGTAALLSVERFDGPIWEPACGDGAMSRVLESHGYPVVSTDLVDRGYGRARIDFLMERHALAPNIITNPPFKLVEPFMRHALALNPLKLALLLRLQCLEGIERRAIYEMWPPARVWVFSVRLSMRRGGGTPIGGGGMMAFAWFVWERGHAGLPTLGWV
jgi:hypothetical protein